MKRDGAGHSNSGELGPGRAAGRGRGGAVRDLRVWLMSALVTAAGVSARAPATGLPAGVEGKMLVLSYNICWQCMTNTPKGSAPTLGAECTCTATHADANGCARTICAEHMARLIEGTPADYGVANYDFVALQEASNWQALEDAAPNTLGKLKAQAYKVEGGPEWSVVFWDGARYALTHHFGGDSGHGYAFQVLIFELARTVFVNVHNCHSHQECSLSTLEEALSATLLDNLGPDELKALRGYRLIVAGDFNRAADLDPEGQMSIAPLGPAGIATRVALQSPPITCCSQATPWKGRRSGDFIFDSRSVASPEIPRSYDVEVPRSDHLPVVALVPR